MPIVYPLQAKLTNVKKIFIVKNGAQCFQDQSNCPRTTFCVCSDCFYGDRCQFYAKGIGLTLDDMFRYELQPSIHIHQQPVSVNVSAALAVIMFVAGQINSILSLMTFYSSGSRQVGAGIYLFASTITSLPTVSVFNVKFWFVTIKHINSSVSRSILRGGCIGLEPILKLCLYVDNWLNACVAIERAMTMYQSSKANRISDLFDPNLFDSIESNRTELIFFAKRSNRTEPNANFENESRIESNRIEIFQKRIESN